MQEALDQIRKAGVKVILVAGLEKDCAIFMYEAG